MKFIRILDALRSFKLTEAILTLSVLAILSISIQSAYACTVASCDDRMLVVGKRWSSDDWMGPRQFDDVMFEPDMEMAYLGADDMYTTTLCQSSVGPSSVMNNSDALAWNHHREQAMILAQATGAAIGTAVCLLASGGTVSWLAAFCGIGGGGLAGWQFSRHGIPMASAGCSVTEITTICTMTDWGGQPVSGGGSSVRVGLDLNC